MATIILEFDQEIKTAFEQAKPEIQKHLSNIIQFLLRDNLHNKSLNEVMA